MTNTVSKKVSDEILNAVMYIESAGKPDASNPLSTAVGLGQFIKSTWLQTVKDHRPDVYKSYSQSDLLALRTNPSFAIEMLARFTEDNLQVMGAGANPGDIYLAHFAGASTARRLIGSDQSMLATSVFSAAAARANPSIIPGKTIKQVRAWASSKMATAEKRADNYVARYYRGPLIVGIGTDFSSMNQTKRPGLSPRGDGRLWDNQAQLRAMNYNPGMLDGVWGGGTAGAIAAFINDYAPNLEAPTSKREYDSNYQAIDAAIDRAEATKWARPVTVQRERAAPEVVEQVAPEIVPAKKGVWVSITGLFGAVTSSMYKVWEWVMGYGDQAREWGLMSYIDRVPAFVWMLIASGLFGYVVYLTVRTAKGIEKPVMTGERL